MRNKIFASLLLSACGSSALYAGEMGAVDGGVNPAYVPFVSGEASYTWPKIGQFSGNEKGLRNITSVADTKGWGGRVAVGLLHAMTERFSYSGEMGWGYYGNTTITPRFHATSGLLVSAPRRALSLGIDEYGFDLLAGILYTQPKYDLFFKAGALLMNTNARVSVDFHDILQNSSRANNFVEGAQIKREAYMPAVLPEIKLGGAYHLNQHWSANVAWMHAFGGDLSMSASMLSFSPINIGNVTWDMHQPSLNTVMFGLEYRFA